MANVTIPGLPTGSALAGTEPLETVQGGVSIQTPVSAVANLGIAVLTRTLTSNGTGALGDFIVRLNSASPISYTVPPNSSVAFPVGTYINLYQYGAGQGSIVAGSGVTIHSKSNWLKLNAQYSWATLYQESANEWELYGDLSA